MLGEQALGDRAQVGGRLQVAVLEQPVRPRPGQFARTRPPATAPPGTKATVPVPWSVPCVPLLRAVRPNSVITSTAVFAQASPSPALSATSPSSSCFSGPARRLGCACVRVPAADLQRGDAGPSAAASSLAGGGGQRREGRSCWRRRAPVPGQHRAGEAALAQALGDGRAGDRVAAVQRARCGRRGPACGRPKLCGSQVPTSPARAAAAAATCRSPAREVRAGRCAGDELTPATRFSQPLVMRWSAPHSMQSCASKWLRLR